MKVLDIIDGTTVDGPGFRTAIYFSGCSHHCHGCHNPESWNLLAGNELSVEQIMARVIENDFNVTFTGGDPLFQIDDILPLALRIKEIGKNIWCYTGYRYEDICRDLSLSRILEFADVIVDGRFELSLRDTTLMFRGSSNQRLIDVSKSEPGSPVVWSSGF